MNRLFINYLIPLFCLLILSSCYQNAFTVEKGTSIEHRKPEYKSFEVAMASLDRFQGIDSCSRDKKDFQEAILRIRHNKLEEADSILMHINTNDKNLTTLVNKYRMILNDLYSNLQMQKPDFSIMDTNRHSIKIAGNKVYVYVYIENTKYKFLVTSTHQTSQIFTPITKKLNFKNLAESKQKSFIDPKINLKEIYLLDSIRIANITAKNLLVYASDPPSYAKYCDGIIGMDILSKFDIRLDFKNEDILFLKSNPQNIDTNYNYTWFFMPIYSAVLSDGTEVKMMLDLFFDISAVFPELFDISTADRDILESYRVKRKGINSDKAYNSQLINNFSLNISGYKFNFSRLICTKFVDIFPNLKIYGILGNDLWVNGRIRLDYQNGVFQYEED
jgi:hypothetical protein